MGDFSYRDYERWQKDQDAAIKAVEDVVNNMRPDLAVLKSEMKTTNRRLALLLAFLASLTLAVISAAVIISLAAKP